MEKQEYLNKIKELDREYKVKKDEIGVAFAQSNAKFKIGDIIKDSRWAFKIDKITFYMNFNAPECVYHGYELKKDLTPRKDKNRVSIYGNDAELIQPVQM